MKRFGMTLLPFFLLFGVFQSAAFGQQATADEVLSKVKAAAEVLSEQGKAGLDQFTKKDTQWVWKDTYIWILKCDEFTAAAHPFAPKFVGRDNSDLVDKRGNYFFMQMCDDADRHKDTGYWTEYWWPKKGQDEPARKVAYTLQAEGTPYQVSAGIYSPTISASELNKQLK